MTISKKKRKLEKKNENSKKKGNFEKNENVVNRIKKLNVK